MSGLIQSFENYARGKGVDLQKRADGNYHRAGTRQAFYLYRDAFEAGQRYERRQAALNELVGLGQDMKLGY